jgi:hypothetical protein
MLESSTLIIHWQKQMALNGIIKEAAKDSQVDRRAFKNGRSRLSIVHSILFLQ